MDWLTNPEIWVAFFTLTALEIVLGIDNIIMISILVSRMPKHMQQRTRIFGLGLAMITRILLLLWITSKEMYHALEGENESGDEPSGKGGNFLYTIIQIAIIDIVFSLDSV